MENRRRGAVIATIALSIVAVLFCAGKPWSDGRTASWLCAANLALLLGHVLKERDSGMIRLLWFGLCFGVVELAADYLCVRFTGTLDYSPAGSAMIGLSPWWMPAAWMIVAVQIGYLGAMAITRWGVWPGACLTAALGAINIPFYEEMAYHAHWWRYQNCRMIGHTPFYIIVTELFIGFALAPLAYRALMGSSLAEAGSAGARAGLATIVAGLLGYGLVERLLP